MGVKRYLNEPRAIKVELGNVLEIYNKNYADIEDISMNFKKSLATDLDDTYLEKKKSTQGVYLDAVKGEVYMHLNTELVGGKIIPSNSNDYVNLRVGVFLLCLAIKFNGIDRYVELQFLDNAREIEVTPDTNRA